jgi:hypothetical protein
MSTLAHNSSPIACSGGGITSGGQLLVTDGQHVHVARNIIANGSCGNCKPLGRTVTAIEIADQAPPPAGVFGLTIDHNDFLIGVGIAIRQNPGNLVSGITISDNRATGFARIDSVTSPADRSNNTMWPGSRQSSSQPSTYRVLRLAHAANHTAARTRAGMPGDATVETVFDLSAGPRPHAASTPLLPCVQANNLPHDMVLASMTCDGHGEVKSILGYSFEETYPNAKPLYNRNASESWRTGSSGGMLVAKVIR